MFERIVYLSGPSGIGKTTIISELIAANPELYMAGNPEKLDRESHVRDKAIKFPSIYAYAMDKIEQRLEDAKRIAEMEKQNPNKIILGDRCLHDTYSYILAAVKYGDLTEEEAKRLIAYQDKIHSQELRPKRIVYIDSSLTSVMRYLGNRSKFEEKGFREDDSTYQQIVIESFREHFKDVKGIFYLTTPFDAAEKIDAWVKETMLGTKDR